MTLRQARPWLYLVAFLAGFGLLAKTTMEFPRLDLAYRAFAIVLILLFSVARMFEWWKTKGDSISSDDGFTDRLLRHQFALQRKFYRWFYDER